ncbi:MAG: glycosyltransferase family 2 protein [Anaerolineae bacterium]|nr:glycosyltransferase family 2 protein [Anaerolineae bacterium]
MTVLAGIILTYNEASHISACIETLRFCDELLVFDSFSSDDTMAQAIQAGARVLQHQFSDYAGQRNAALEAVRGVADWVLFVDADERVTPELAQEVRRVIETPGYAAWQIPRHNYIFGKLTQGAGWYPDYQTRLLRVGKAHYDPARPVHETAALDGKLGSTEHPFVHYNYRDPTHFAEKQRRYSAYDAQILYAQGVQPKLRQLISMPLRQFWWRFITLKGYRDGLHGLHLSALMAWYELRKYHLLRQLWTQNETGRG